MTPEYLDLILRTLLNKGSGVKGPELLSIEAIEKGDLLAATNFLEGKNLIRKHTYGVEPYWDIILTDDGKYFISNGGFTEEERLKKEPLKYSKRAINISIFAIIIAAAVAIGVCIVQLKCNNTTTKTSQVKTNCKMD